MRRSAWLVLAFVFALVLAILGRSRAVPVVDEAVVSHQEEQPARKPTRFPDVVASSASVVPLGPATPRPFLVMVRLVAEDRALLPPDGATVRIVEVDAGERTVSVDDVGVAILSLSLSDVRALKVEAPGYVGAELDREDLQSRAARTDSLETTLTRDIVSDAGQPDVRWVTFMGRGREVVGRIIGHGRGIEGTRVRCMRSERSLPGPVALTDFDGHFSVMCPDSEQFQIQALHPQWRATVSEVLTTTPVTLMLEKGVLVSGVVTDADGNPVEGARVWLHDPADEEWLKTSRARSNADGEFSMDSSASGTLQLMALGSDGSTFNHEVELDEAEGERRLTLRLAAGDEVSGVVTLDGVPVGNVMVGSECSINFPLGLQLTRADGSFKIPMVKQPPSDEHCVIVATPGDADEVMWDLRGALGGFLTTQVAAPRGTRDVRVELKSETPGALEITFMGRFAEYGGHFELQGLDEATARPGTLNTFLSRAASHLLERIRAGRYRLTTRLDDGESPASVDVVVATGSTTRIALRVPDGAARGEATGRFVDARTGRPIPHLPYCHSQDYTSASFSDVADREGRFHFSYSAARLSVSVGRSCGELEGYQPLTVERAVGPGESAQLGDVLVSPAAP